MYSSESTILYIGFYGRQLEEGTWETRNGWDRVVGAMFTSTPLLSKIEFVH
jgi:hypothetical protein